MRTDRKQIVLVCVVIFVALAFFGFYVQVNLRYGNARLADQRIREAQEVSRLEKEIARLRQIQQELSNAGFVTNEALLKESRNAEILRKKLDGMIAQNKAFANRISRAAVEKKALAQDKDELDADLEVLKVQNEGLHKEVELLRRNFDVALQARVRLAQVEEAIDGLIIQKGKEDILRLQMDALIREVEDINQYLREVRDNRIVPRPAASGVRTAAEPATGARAGRIDAGLEIKYLSQVNDLKARINILTNDNTVLREKLRLAEDMTGRNKQAADSGSQKIAQLQSRLIEAESDASQARTRYQDLERSVASLRERYVANELEKEGLKIKLNRLTAELNDVRSKFLALLGKITDIFQSPGSGISSSQRSDLTGVIGVELFPNTTDIGK
ncbi:MAG TPA: hypothetical protein PLP56_00335 [Candidatus Omnitrophota bacterium]|nr:hypothetical protein [Candidatus Omnitrophota bacterium]HQO37195.1 hypothetical protein [Candidatus Omnitrophota bacterium]HQQ05410.1 hypothetical protein [Candidatus Omnitrophota bacterium]